MALVHTIGAVSAATGLSVHTIRAWERRYSTLLPNRTATNRRLYTESDVEKLKLLRQLVNAGHSIGQIAALSAAELRRLAELSTHSEPAHAETGHEDTVLHVARCIDAVAHFNAPGLEIALARSVAALGIAVAVDDVIRPLMLTIGDHWTGGRLGPADEHMASAVLRTFLGGMLASFRGTPDAPVLIATTPVGQLHELGALMAAVTAAAEGWRVAYLGPNLPASQIAFAVKRSHASALALSLVLPGARESVAPELTALSTSLEPGVRVLVGGHAAGEYADVIAEVGFTVVADMRGFRRELDRLSPPATDGIRSRFETVVE